ncbi:hypothetical protein HPB51_002980 [Rhipicephalus microplus]|uniref:Tyrosine specific protein phosphatases domain-containing protein n=1 Tax=Rhipicephalus microplus TaxID=6941 RepID=A0A9J6EEX9_RHIMP|nr:hypothetical protein HPB51_002980 [Rhipicephalus microplus]
MNLYCTHSHSDASLHDELRKEDIELLRLLSVDQICDFMVEGKKKKCGIKITSSEKVDRSKRYQDFTIFKLPYPGCEFFEKYVKQHYNPEGLFYDWTQRWDLVELTKNYLKFLLKVVIDGDSSILVHCISGWDRTALFVSLLRLSLWADNAIHQNLSALEMAYLTAAYDWFLFSLSSGIAQHQVPGGDLNFDTFTDAFLSTTLAREIGLTPAKPPAAQLPETLLPRPA